MLGFAKAGLPTKHIDKVKHWKYIENLHKNNFQSYDFNYRNCKFSISLQKRRAQVSSHRTTTGLLSQLCMQVGLWHLDTSIVCFISTWGRRQVHFNAWVTSCFNSFIIIIGKSSLEQLQSCWVHATCLESLMGTHVCTLTGTSLCQRKASPLNLCQFAYQLHCCTFVTVFVAKIALLI